MSDIVERLKRRGAPLTRAREISPTAELCREAAGEIEQLRAQVERLTKALKVCAEPYATPPGTIADCQRHIAAQFQYRMDVACEALTSTKQPSVEPDRG